VTNELYAPADPPVEAPIGTSRGTRVLGYLAAVLLGALFGAIGTVVHPITWSVFGAELPTGMVLALAAIALLLTGLRLIAPSRLAAGLAAAALVGVVALLTLESPGGSVLVPAGTLGLVWLFGSTLIAVVVIAWPRLGGSGGSGRSAGAGGMRGAAHPAPRDAVDSTW
jgi:hypothetical protein